MTAICYSGAAAYRITEIADAVATHLNYLATGKDSIKLASVTEVAIEDADQSQLAPSMYEEFRKLEALAPESASTFRRKLVGQRIVAQLLSAVYGELENKIVVLSGKYTRKDDRITKIMIGSAINNRKAYSSEVRKKFRGILDVEENIKRVFEQVALPQVDDLALSQAKGFAMLQSEFVNRTNEILEAIGKQNLESTRRK